MSTAVLFSCIMFQRIALFQKSCTFFQKKLHSFEQVIVSDGIQGICTGSRKPVLGISARLGNPLLN